MHWSVVRLMNHLGCHDWLLFMVGLSRVRMRGNLLVERRPGLWSDTRGWLALGKRNLRWAEVDWDEERVVLRRGNGRSTGWMVCTQHGICRVHSLKLGTLWGRAKSNASAEAGGSRCVMAAKGRGRFPIRRVATDKEAGISDSFRTGKPKGSIDLVGRILTGFCPGMLFSWVASVGRRLRLEGRLKRKTNFLGH